jgi:hypothetical protein
MLPLYSIALYIIAIYTSQLELRNERRSISQMKLKK